MSYKCHGLDYLASTTDGEGAGCTYAGCWWGDCHISRQVWCKWPDVEEVPGAIVINIRLFASGIYLLT